MSSAISEEAFPCSLMKKGVPLLRWHHNTYIHNLKPTMFFFQSDCFTNKKIYANVIF